MTHDKTVPFPPLAAHQAIKDMVDRDHQEAREALEMLTNEEVQWMDRINKITQEMCSTRELKEDFRKQLVDLALPFLRKSFLVGRELYGDAWHEDHGILWLAQLAFQVTCRSICPQCIRGEHEFQSDLHVVDDDEDEEDG